MLRWQQLLFLIILCSMGCCLKFDATRHRKFEAIPVLQVHLLKDRDQFCLGIIEKYLAGWRRKNVGQSGRLSAV